MDVLCTPEQQVLTANCFYSLDLYTRVLKIHVLSISCFLFSTYTWAFYITTYITCTYRGSGALWMELLHRSKKEGKRWGSQFFFPLHRYYWVAKAHCPSLIMLFISSTSVVCTIWCLCTHWHHIVPLGAANRFVWPGSPFCLSPSLSLTPLLLAPPDRLVPKPDIKKGLLKNNVGNFLPPWELSPRCDDALSFPLTFPLHRSLSIAFRQRFGGVTTTVGGWWGEDVFLGGRSLFLSACATSLSLCRVPAEMWRGTVAGGYEGISAGPWWPSLCRGEEVKK